MAIVLIRALFGWKGSGGRVLSLSGGGRHGEARGLLLIIVGVHGLTVKKLGWGSKSKTEAMEIRYIGSLISWDRTDNSDVHQLTELASKAFGLLRKEIFVTNPSKRSVECGISPQLS